METKKQDIYYFLQLNKTKQVKQHLIKKHPNPYPQYIKIYLAITIIIIIINISYKKKSPYIKGFSHPKYYTEAVQAAGRYLAKTVV